MAPVINYKLLPAAHQKKKKKKKLAIPAEQHETTVRSLYGRSVRSSCWLDM